MPADRTHDIVLFGATGFTGALTAEYLARNAPANCRLALAGRNRAKLEQVRGQLAKINPACAELPLLHADVADADSLRTLAESTRVVITTVGPYMRYGEPLVAACAEAGTDYLDLTGESEFVDRMYLRHHDRATFTGARLVHAAGFDSIPHDLGAYFTVRQLPKEVPLRVEGVVRVNTRPSSGTLHTLVTAFSRTWQTLSAARERRRVEGRPTDRKVGSTPLRPRRVRTLGAWAVPLPAVDPMIVQRSARALPEYGPDFRYGHFFATRHLPVIAGLAGTAAGLFALAQIPPARRWLLARFPAGDGPSEERRAKSWFSVRFVGLGGGRRVVTEVSGGDPGYDETAKMLGESALCLALDELPATAGQVTTAAAMGQSLIDRLQHAGIPFDVLEDRAV
ncbi:MAG: saccharopine dehydrogenase [Pseudonocardiaceae bacterium]|nr:saccharopine dehydrogenase [Pseudonocardiaceae bacterium]